MLKGVFFCSRVHSGAVSKQTSKPTENTEHHITTCGFTLRAKIMRIFMN